MTIKTYTLPKAFIWRRLHSLTGLWLVGFLIIHLLSNSQAALFIGEDASGFVKAANDIKSLPYLPVIEIALLAVPFIVHMFWGVQYLLTGQFNSYQTDGTKPAMPYPRNKAYTWQRLTSWILLVLITMHVVQMRFMEEPAMVRQGPDTSYLIRLNEDAGIYTLSERLGFKLFDQHQIVEQKKRISKLTLPEKLDTPEALIQAQKVQQEQAWVEALEKRPLLTGQLMVVAKDFGTAELLLVRETFKSPSMIVLYTVLVLSACFHAFNGLWTFLITWGVTLSPRSQKTSKKVAISLLVLIAFLGLAAVWGTYWINLKQ